MWMLRELVLLWTLANPGVCAPAAEENGDVNLPHPSGYVGETTPMMTHMHARLGLPR